MRKPPTYLAWFFGFLISLIYGAVFSGQILGLAGIYRGWLAILLTALTTGGIFYLYLKKEKEFLGLLQRPGGNVQGEGSWLKIAFAISGIGLLIVLVLVPLIRWPYSPITTDLPWDAGLYHFPKAIEMLSTGSAWDMTISYGEYPFGYESLAALAFALNHAGLLLGAVHALIALFFFFSIVLLIARYTRLPRAPVIFIVSILILGQFLAPKFDSNIWWIFWPQTILIGKNDLFLASALLAILLHTPTSRHGPFFPVGLAVVSMIALSIKPNAALVVLFAWIVLLLFLWRAGQFKRYFRELVLSAVVVLPGMLWIIRNFAAQGRLFSPESMYLADWSIASNLSNPYLYDYLPQHFYYVLIILGLALIVSFFRRNVSFHFLAALVLLVTFALTPASAFFGTTQVPAQIAWRFAMALLAYLFVLLLIIFEPLINPVYAWLARRRSTSSPLILFVVAFSICATWIGRDLLEIFPENEIVLQDQYRTPVGVDGYYSAYDYVQKNVHNSVVIVENGLPFYLYDAEFTNSVTRSRPADYVVYLQTPWLGGEKAYPEMLGQPEWSETWQMVYEDSEGRVYQRK